MLAPLLMLWPMSLVFTYAVAQNIANKPYDRELGEMARAIARQVAIESATAAHGCACLTSLPKWRAPTIPTAYFRVLGARRARSRQHRPAAPDEPAVPTS
jgi:two-component system sensor histidine kinase TctE